MNIKVYLLTRDNECDAVGIYNGESLKVLKGSKIRSTFAEHVKGGKTAKRYREDSSMVDCNNILLQDCVFRSPSTAAQFVTGASVNGLLSWHIDKKTSLKRFLDVHSMKANQ